MIILADIVNYQNDEHADHILHFANGKKLINADLLILIWMTRIARGRDSVGHPALSRYNAPPSLIMIGGGGPDSDMMITIRGYDHHVRIWWSPCYNIMIIWCSVHRRHHAPPEIIIGSILDSDQGDKSWEMQMIVGHDTVNHWIENRTSLAPPINHSLFTLGDAAT